MEDKRRAEVNRRLAEFQFGNTNLGMDIFADKAMPIDYTVDLNALVRLEAKLPLHGWDISYTPDAFVTLRANNGEEWAETIAPTEAEARAEAICQYLESQKGEGA